MIPSTISRVEVNTAPAVNERINADMERRVRRYSSASASEIRSRLEELDREWDVERMIEANASTLSLIGFALGRFVDKRFYALPVVVASFLLQHAIQGWCPPVPVLRGLGVRTADEIERERRALRALR